MTRFFYKTILKPILFSFPADDIHQLFLRIGNYLGKKKVMTNIMSFLWRYKDGRLNQEITGIKFENPIGLAAGFDYNAELIGVIPSVGFGFSTVGTVTRFPYGGNAKPMLGRLPKSKSFLVNKGFKNDGIVKILNNISDKEKGVPVGLSIGSTNMLYKKIEELIDDICSSFELAIKNDNFDYFELNISCPNLVNAESLKDKLDTPIGFGMLLNKLSYMNIHKPLFIKMFSEKSKEETIALCEVATKYKWVNGFIFSNLVKDRTNPLFDREEIRNAGNGNFSGKPTEAYANELISIVYQKYRDRFIIIGCGGVFSGIDAYEKIKRGATLIQLITGMIYEGPSQIGNINKELVALLKKDKFENIKDAIGSYYK